ncbi:class I SAM-dependent methyltransferase [Rhodanobacter ginsengisoli]|uniref:Class I SAM-dependent methyltransferase n=1 Tax=Rhodanobacter ginsengisoli TaxID=418646 RepID=A0ABW0QL07_9GAMM
MRPTMLALLITLALPAVAQAGVPKPHDGAVTATVRKAIADPARATDKADDARRKMAQVMMFAGVKPGQKVLELVPGKGYWTRVFSAIVGPKGHVYTVWPDEMGKYSTESLASWNKLVATPHYANVSLLVQPAAKLSVPMPVDLVFTSQNYHDYHDPFMGPVDMAKFDRQVYDALKPGGLFVVIDHVAPAGSGLADTNTLHRIDPAVVRREVESAGFVFDGESDALRNPQDPHTNKVFDKSIRGHTDQFIYRFRKPAK